MRIDVIPRGCDCDVFVKEQYFDKTPDDEAVENSRINMTQPLDWTGKTSYYQCFCTRIFQ